MKFELSNDVFENLSLKNEDLKEEILQTNDKSRIYGLELSTEEASKIVIRGNEIIKETERIEFGKSITAKLIEKFMKSSYITQNEYEETIEGLLEIFYEIKDACLEALYDDEIIEMMFEDFENECGGDLETLENKELEEICRKIRG